MARRNRHWVTGLEDFGLTKRRLRDLGTRPVTVEISIPVSPHVYPSAARFRDLLKLSPQDRRNIVRQWQAVKHGQLIRELPCQEYEVVRYNSVPVGVRVTVPADSVHKLFGLRNAESIRIEAIGGRKRRQTLKEESRLYAVKARFVYQTEGQTTGLQLCEERIFLMSAKSEEHARHRATREFRQEESLFLTVSGHFCRLRFDQILDVCEPLETSFDPAGTEVYYKYRKRRMRPANEWHPKGRPNKGHALGAQKDARK